MTTQEALNESVAHWERMATGKQGSDESPNGSDCSLCRLFAMGKEPACSGCPVMQKTGFSGCWETPYYRARAEWCEHDFSDRFRELAAKELEFLKSLSVEETK